MPLPHNVPRPRLTRVAPNLLFAGRAALLEQHYFAQNEKEYHALLQEFYLSEARRQHQAEQHRLNQVLYGPFDHLPHNPNLPAPLLQQQYSQQQQQQQPLSAPALQQRMPLSQYNAVASTNQAPPQPQPQAMSWQQARPAQLAGSKRHCEPFGDQGAAPKRPAFR